MFQYRLWSIITGADISINSKIGGGPLFPHPNGIGTHPHANIGFNCLIFQQVTIRTRSKGIPTIGGHVDIGAGAKILGPVNIVNYARIVANAVVLTDVPEHGVMVGNPGRLLPSK